MVFAVDVFILGSIILLGMALYYVIWDCARKDFIRALECEKQKARTNEAFMREVVKEHPNNNDMKVLTEEYSDGCSKLEECKF